MERLFSGSAAEFQGEYGAALIGVLINNRSLQLRYQHFLRFLGLFKRFGYPLTILWIQITKTSLDLFGLNLISFQM